MIGSYSSNYENSPEEVKFEKDIVKALEQSLPDEYCYRPSDLTISPSCSAPFTEKGLLTCNRPCSDVPEKWIKSKFLRTIFGTCIEECNIVKKPSCTTFLGIIIYPEGYSWTKWHWTRSFTPESKYKWDMPISCPDTTEKKGNYCIFKA